MAKLVLKEFRCVKDTSEEFPDSPYFLVFVGEARNGSSRSDVKLIRKEAWDNEVDGGELRTPNVTVIDGFGLDLVLVALIEEDWDADLVGSNLIIIRGWMHAAFDRLAANVSTGVDNTIASLVIDEFRKVLRQRLQNDEILGVWRLKTEDQGGGLLPLLNFHGDGGHYRVRFKVA